MCVYLRRKYNAQSCENNNFSWNPNTPTTPKRTQKREKERVKDNAVCLWDWNVRLIGLKEWRSCLNFPFVIWWYQAGQFVHMPKDTTPLLLFPSPFCRGSFSKVGHGHSSPPPFPLGCYNSFTHFMYPLCTIFLFLFLVFFTHLWHLETNPQFRCIKLWRVFS